ncbi:MAG TPA: hypothetical protein DEA78_15910 [Cyanobacteria bacterium UBA11159]|nr:hypothetical protein [Cyanobacteria bacterium UBA11367]HBE59566.1 hypothetical protein [Cyanobacteria bacterium UBA11366]HBR75143.1 hypothetical protein [Cyanobacteria bacterium UBA11159]HBS68060.1 hypothetical protein [Cyanobacteria bacterium UBA11153]HCA95917.1 hypothetical protein [Cyanobacteria bacterium UBA9226]
MAALNIPNPPFAEAFRHFSFGIECEKFGKIWPKYDGIIAIASPALTRSQSIILNLYFRCIAVIIKSG